MTSSSRFLHLWATGLFAVALLIPCATTASSSSSTSEENFTDITAHTETTTLEKTTTTLAPTPAEKCIIKFKDWYKTVTGKDTSEMITFPYYITHDMETATYCSYSHNITKCLNNLKDNCSTEMAGQQRELSKECRLEHAMRQACGQAMQTLSYTKDCLKDITEQTMNCAEISGYNKFVYGELIINNSNVNKDFLCRQVNHFLECEQTKISNSGDACPSIANTIRDMHAAWLQPIAPSNCSISNAYDCVTEAVHECTDPFFRQDSLKDHDGDPVQPAGVYIGAPHNQTNLLNFCHIHNEMQRCIYNFQRRDRCEDHDREVSYTYEQIENPARYICNDVFHEFIEFKECLSPEVTKYCVETFELSAAYAAAQDLVHVKETRSFSQKQRVCGLIKNYLACESAIWKSIPTCSTLEPLIYKMQVLWLEPLTKQFDCTYGSGLSDGAIAGIVLGSLLGAALLFSVCGNFCAKPNRSAKL